MTRRTLLTACLTLAVGVAGVLAGQSPAELRIVTYNIKHGRGMDDKVDLERTAGVLRPLRPDFVGLQEVDDRATRSGSVPEAERLGQMLGMEHAFGKFMDFQGGGYGLAVLSRFPIVRSSSLRLPEGNEPRVALVAEVRLPDETMMAVVNVHFDWVQDDRFRFAQAEVLAKFLDTLTMSYVLLGDFNDVRRLRPPPGAGRTGATIRSLTKAARAWDGTCLRAQPFPAPDERRAEARGKQRHRPGLGNDLRERVVGQSVVDLGAAMHAVKIEVRVAQIGLAE